MKSCKNVFLFPFLQERKQKKSANVIPVVFCVMSCRAHAHITVNSIRKKRSRKLVFQMENRQQSMMGLVRFFFFECCFSFGQKIKFDLGENSSQNGYHQKKKFQTFVRAQNIILSILMIKIQSSIHHHHHHHR